MSNFSKTTNFTAKDALLTGDPSKLVKGSDFDTEFDAIETASATKANKISGGTADYVVEQDANGDLVDTGLATPSSAFVGLTDTQTLTNKTLTTPRVDAIKAGGTNTQTFPTSTDTIVGRATTDTLTNKTINDASNTVGLVSLADEIKPWIEIEQIVLSGDSTVGFENLDTDYNRFIFKVDSLEPGSDNAFLEMLVGTGGTPTYQTSNYYFMVHYGNSGDTDDVYTRDNAAAASILRLTGATIGNTATEGYDGTVEFTNPESASLATRFLWEGIHEGIGGLTTFSHGGGAWITATAVTAVQFKMSTGTLGTGTITLYGLRT